jgi:hypothetical protein
MKEATVVRKGDFSPSALRSMLDERLGDLSLIEMADTLLPTE